MTGVKTPKKTGDKGINPEFRAQAGKGRPKGVPNKATAMVKDMVMTALNNVGGAKYLQRQATENPVAFMTLVGKVIPLQIAGTGEDGKIVVEIVRLAD